MPVKRVLRKKLSVTLIVRPEIRERFRIFTSLTFQKIYVEFQELRTGYEFPKRGFAGPTTGSLPEFPHSQPHMRFFSNLKHFYMPPKNPESHFNFLRAWRVREPDKPKLKPALHTQIPPYGNELC